MNQFELVTLLDQFNTALGAGIMNFATILFAYVLAIFFAGSQLPKWVLITITAIYTTFASVSALSIFFNIGRLSAVREELAALPIEEIGPVVIGINQSIASSGLGYTMFAIIIGGAYSCSIAFLFYILKSKSV